MRISGYSWGEGREEEQCRAGGKVIVGLHEITRVRLENYKAL